MKKRQVAKRKTLTPLFLPHSKKDPLRRPKRGEIPSPWADRGIQKDGVVILKKKGRRPSYRTFFKKEEGRLLREEVEKGGTVRRGSKRRDPFWVDLHSRVALEGARGRLAKRTHSTGGRGGPKVLEGILHSSSEECLGSNGKKGTDVVKAAPRGRIRDSREKGKKAVDDSLPTPGKNNLL